MSEYNLLWEHPLGDPVMLPCVHMVPQHPGGHGSVPCIHKVPQHPGGHKVGIVTVACTHLVTQHPSGDPVPCLHLVQQHPGGDPAPAPGGGILLVPCIHPLPVTRSEATLNLIFHTDDSAVQSAVFDAVHTLMNTLQIRSVGNPLRPLHICARDWAQGVAAGEDNPFWSHYDRIYHAIQIAPPHLTDKQVVLHELGHALAGTQLTWIRRWVIDPHEMKTSYDPGYAMSEGWAHFVALAILNEQDARTPHYRGETDWETRDPSVVKTNDIEYNIACLLWDLYDRNNDMESASFSFKELFGVLSPTLETIDSGPVVTGSDDYLDRLRTAFPGKVETINRVRDLHLSSKKVASGLVGGAGGGEFWDDTEGVLGISRITVRSGSLIDAIQIDYIIPGDIRHGDRHGGTGGSESVHDLAPREYITSIDGQTDGSIVKQMTFHLSRKLASGTTLRSAWSVGQPGRLWVTLIDLSGSTTRIDVVPGGTISVDGNSVPVSSSTTVGTTINTPGRGDLIVEGENAFHIECADMVGFYGRSGQLLDAIGVMY